MLYGPGIVEDRHSPANSLFLDDPKLPEAGVPPVLNGSAKAVPSSFRRVLTQVKCKISDFAGRLFRAVVPDCCRSRQSRCRERQQQARACLRELGELAKAGAPAADIHAAVEKTARALHAWGRVDDDANRNLDRIVGNDIDMLPPPVLIALARDFPAAAPAHAAKSTRAAKAKTETADLIERMAGIVHIRACNQLMHGLCGMLRRAVSALDAPLTLPSHGVELLEDAVRHPAFDQWIRSSAFLPANAEAPSVAADGRDFEVRRATLVRQTLRTVCDSDERFAQVLAAMSSPTLLQLAARGDEVPDPEAADAVLKEITTRRPESLLDEIHADVAALARDLQDHQGGEVLARDLRLCAKHVQSFEKHCDLHDLPLPAAFEKIREQLRQQVQVIIATMSGTPAHPAVLPALFDLPPGLLPPSTASAAPAPIVEAVDAMIQNAIPQMTQLFIALVTDKPAQWLGACKLIADTLLGPLAAPQTWKSQDGGGPAANAPDYVGKLVEEAFATVGPAVAADIAQVVRQPEYAAIVGVLQDGAGIAAQQGDASLRNQMSACAQLLDAIQSSPSLPGQAPEAPGAPGPEAWQALADLFWLAIDDRQQLYLKFMTYSEEEVAPLQIHLSRDLSDDEKRTVPLTQDISIPGQFFTDATRAGVTFRLADGTPLFPLAPPNGDTPNGSINPQWATDYALLLAYFENRPEIVNALLRQCHQGMLGDTLAALTTNGAEHSLLPGYPAALVQGAGHTVEFTFYIESDRSPAVHIRYIQPELAQLIVPLPAFKEGDPPALPPILDLDPKLSRAETEIWARIDSQTGRIVLGRLLPRLRVKLVLTGFPRPQVQELETSLENPEYGPHVLSFIRTSPAYRALVANFFAFEDLKAFERMPSTGNALALFRRYLANDAPHHVAGDFSQDDASRVLRRWSAFDAAVRGLFAEVEQAALRWLERRYAEVRRGNPAFANEPARYADFAAAGNGGSDNCKTFLSAMERNPVDVAMLGFYDDVMEFRNNPSAALAWAHCAKWSSLSRDAADKTIRAVFTGDRMRRVQKRIATIDWLSADSGSFAAIKEPLLIPLHPPCLALADAVKAIG